MKRSNFGSFVVSALLIVSATFIFSWQFILPKYKANKTELARLEFEIDSAHDKLDSLKTAESSLASLGNLVSKILVAMPGDSDMPNLITELEAIAIKHGVYIPSIQVTDSTATASSTQAAPTDSIASNAISFSFAVNGSYESLIEFLESIEKDIRFMNIESMSFGATEEGASLSLSVETYKRSSMSLSSASTPATSITTPGE